MQMGMKGYNGDLLATLYGASLLPSPGLKLLGACFVSDLSFLRAVNAIFVEDFELWLW